MSLPAPSWKPTDRGIIETEECWVVPIRRGLEHDIAIELKIPVVPVTYSSSYVAGRVRLEDFRHIATMLELTDESERMNYKHAVEVEKMSCTRPRGVPWI